MKQRHRTFAALATLIFLGGAWYFLSDGNREGLKEVYQVDPILSGESAVSPYGPLLKRYEEGTFGFSFNYPEEYEVTVFEEPVGGATFVVQDKKSDGFQVIVSPFDEPLTALTEERVRRDIPDLTIEAVQPVLLGDAGQGIAFVSDNDAFGGASREVWFVFDGYLFQISTYLKNDPLLQAVLGTWELK